MIPTLARAVVASIVLLACSPEPEPPARLVDRVDRLVVEIEPDSHGKEVKARAGDEFRNVLFEPGGTQPAAHHRTQPLRLAGPATLDFGMAIEGELRPGQRARFDVWVEHGGKRDPLYAREVRGDAGWVDARVDLSAFVGETLRLDFQAELLGGGAARPLWGGPVLVPTDAEGSSTRPSLILVSLDTLRADHLGSYGYSRDTSPHFDALARESLLFEDVVAPSSWTTPSHATVFTGESPVVHGAGGLAGHRLQRRFVTLAELLRERGSFTAAFTEGVAVAASLGFDQGFDVYSNGPNVRPLRAGSAEATFARAADWVERRDEQPFLLFVHTYEIHWPYRAPGEFADRYSGDGVARLDAADAADPEYMNQPLTTAQRASVVAAYDSGIAYTDAVFGAFLDRLRAAGVLDRAAVVVFSDHGEEFWEHGASQHGLSLYDEVLRVPLLIRLPGAAPPRGRIERTVALADVFATLVDLFDLDTRVPAGSESLRPLWEPRPGEGYERKSVTSELVQTPLKWLMLATRDERWKYIATTAYGREESPLYDRRAHEGDPTAVMEQRLVDHLVDGGRDLERAQTEAERQRMFLAAREELFDVDDDPGELRDLVPDGPAELKRVRKTLSSELTRFAADAERIDAPMEPVAPLTEEEKEALRALGYAR